MDYTGLRAELGRLMADARDVLEADKFITGAGEGSNEPEGLVAGLAASSDVLTGAAGTFAIADVYALQEDLPSRFQPRARWLGSNQIANAVYRFVGTGDPNEPPLMNEARDRILGKPYNEVSTMATSVAAGNDILLYGDLMEAFRIVERIGMSVELIPHLFGPNRRPTGERGLYAFARVSSGVLIDNAARILKVATT